MLLILTLVNMRGVHDTGVVFMIPTYLFTATLLTLFILPILYPWFEPKPKVREELDEENPHALLDASI